MAMVVSISLWPPRSVQAGSSSSNIWVESLQLPTSEEEGGSNGWGYVHTCTPCEVNQSSISCSKFLWGHFLDWKFLLGVARLCSSDWVGWWPLVTSVLHSSGSSVEALLLCAYCVCNSVMCVYREYGDQWHKGGTFEKKQNVFDDFIAAGEYLIGSGYTSSSKYVNLFYSLPQPPPPIPQT